VPAIVTIYDEILEPYRSGDWHECARRLRLSVESDPFATLPRHILANLYVRLGQQGLALVHYEKLLPVAVGKGELLRAMVVQRGIDELHSRPNAAARFAAMHRWFRLLGEQNLSTVAGLRNQGVSALTLLRLPSEGFVAAALGFKAEAFELEPRSGTFEGGAQWSTLWGTARWRIVSAEGRPVGEGRADEGATIRTDRSHGTLTLLVSPETPGEWICFGREVMDLLVELDPELSRDEGLESDFVRDERPRFSAAPQMRSDLDRGPRRRRAEPPKPAGEAPPRLTLGGGTSESPGPRDSGDWVEFGQVDLDGTGARIEKAPEPVSEPLPLDPSIQISRRGLDEPPATASADRAIEHPGSDPTPPDRRHVKRVPVTFSARVALLGLGASRDSALVGDVVDLSMGGVGLRFPARDLEHALTVLKDETLRIDLITPDGHYLELAGRVRWLDFSQPETVAGGVQFVLLTDADRESIARLVMDADPGV